MTLFDLSHDQSNCPLKTKRVHRIASAEEIQALYYDASLVRAETKQDFVTVFNIHRMFIGPVFYDIFSMKTISHWCWWLMLVVESS